MPSVDVEKLQALCRELPTIQSILYIVQCNDYAIWEDKCNWSCGTQTYTYWDADCTRELALSEYLYIISAWIKEYMYPNAGIKLTIGMCNAKDLFGGGAQGRG